MICVSVTEPTVAACARALRRLPFAEVRLDLLRDGDDGLERLFAGQGWVVATCRRGTLRDSERRERLLRAAAAGAAFVDVELDSPRPWRRELVAAARRYGCWVIVSHHDFERTPASNRLAAIVRRCFDEGADVAKVACRAHAPEDCARLLALLATGRPIVPLGLGPEGRVTRVAAPLLGAPFTYAALRPDRPAGPGQLSRAELQRLLQAMGGEPRARPARSGEHA